MPVHIIDHPVVQDALIELRDARTPPDRFRLAADRISGLLVAEALRGLPTEPVTVESPLGPADGRRIRADVVVIPVLRAGLGMLTAALRLLPGARVGQLGLERDESTGAASMYYAKLPADLSDSYVLLVDPMLATGGSAVAALRLLRDAGARDIRLVCIVAAPEGLAAVERHDPAVWIYTPAVDRGLDARNFILPGLGDFGDRLFGTA